MSTGSAARDAHEGDAPDEGAEIDIEPDYRFTLANERTFLAWNRTSLGLIAGGVAVLQLVPEFGPTGSRHIVGALLAILGIVVSLASLRRWALVQRAMRRDADLPPSRLPLVLTGGLIVVTLAVVALVLAAR